MRKRFKINCLECGADYSAAKKRTKFCSRSCGSKWNHKNNDNFKKTLKNLYCNHNIKRIEVVCNFCEMVYTIPPNRKERTKYCSAKCRSSAIYCIHKDKMIENARKVCTGRVAPNRGIPHSEEVVRKIIQASSDRPNGFWRIKYKKFIDKKSRSVPLKSSYEIAFVEQYLDKNNFDWEYEPEIFKLSNGKFYIPDFYIEEQNKWYEVKGWVKHKSVEKFNMFKKEYPKIDINLITKKELEEDFLVNLSTSSVKSIMEKWRIYDRKQEKNPNAQRSPVKVTSGIKKQFLMKTPNMLETPKALSTGDSDNFKDGNNGQSAEIADLSEALRDYQGVSL